MVEDGQFVTIAEQIRLVFASIRILDREIES